MAPNTAAPHTIHEADQHGLGLLFGGGLGGPIGKVKDEKTDDEKIAGTVQEAHADAEAGVEAFPQAEPQIASLVTVVDVEVGVDLEGGDLEGDGHDDETEDGRQGPDVNGIDQADMREEPMKNLAHERGQQEAEQNTTEGKRRADGTLPPAGHSHRRDQNNCKDPNGHNFRVEIVQYKSTFKSIRPVENRRATARLGK